MRYQLWTWSAIGNHNEDRLKTSFPRELHGWNTISVIRDEDYPIRKVLSRIGRNVESYPHINALLFKLGRKICIGDRRARRGISLKASKLQDSTSNGK